MMSVKLINVTPDAEKTSHIVLECLTQTTKIDLKYYISIVIGVI